MLKLIQIGAAYPISGPVDPDPAVHFRPGMFGQMVRSGKSWHITVSDGRKPVGIIDDVRDGVDDTTIGSSSITLWTAPGIYATDQFETGEPYPDGVLLRVNDKGVLTSRHIGGHCSVGCACAPLGATAAVLADGCLQFKLSWRIWRI